MLFCVIEGNYSLFCFTIISETSQVTFYPNNLQGLSEMCDPNCLNESKATGLTRAFAD
jgi:hypothetical protein